MILIVESGATKADWCSVSDDGSVGKTRTDGLNPMVLSVERMKEIASSAIPAVNPSGKNISRIFYYGAGVVSDEAASLIMEALYPWCPFAEVECQSDMVAAGRALFGSGSGVVAILGTGSNSCLWQDGRMVRNIRPGGYILGDEGGGATLGKMLLSDVVKGLVPASFSERLSQEFDLDYNTVVSSLYRGEAPSRYLASFARFIVGNRDDEYAGRLLEDNLRAFIERSLIRYGCGNVGVAGSLGYACRDVLERLGREYGLEFVKFIQAPADELIKYHTDVI